MKSGKLTVLGFSHFKGEGKKREVFWLCQCDCGKQCVTRSNNLSGHAKSCGCAHKEAILRVVEQYKVTHGASRRVGGTIAPEYISFEHAKQRCTNKNNKSYEDYGGRGIKFLFEDFESFYKELGPRPTPRHTLDRTNNEGNYEVGNVRWATRAQQNNNRRPMKRKEHHA
jgi:hypothetical protein